MPKALFDQKFGAQFAESLSTEPGVYLLKNEAGEVIYVGKAKNLRRRLSTYRNASRKKAHRKMVRLVKAAASVSVEVLSSEQEALLRENALILELKPKYNVEGAFAFLYPALGVGIREKHTWICFSTRPHEYASLDLSWYGTFRSRVRVRAAFDALIDLLGLVGHQEKSSALGAVPRVRGSRLVAFRQVPLELRESLPWFFAGEDGFFLSDLSRQLLMKPRARRDASEVQEKLLELKVFFEKDAVRLREALRKLGRPGSFVSAEERDAFMIRARAGEGSK